MITMLVISLMLVVVYVVLATIKLGHWPHHIAVYH